MTLREGRFEKSVQQDEREFLELLLAKIREIQRGVGRIPDRDSTEVRQILRESKM